MGIGQTDGQSSDVPPSQYLSGLRKTHTGGMNLAKLSSSSRNAAVLRRLGKGIVRRDVCIRGLYAFDNQYQVSISGRFTAITTIIRTLS
jgi:hypothetical protein